MVFVTLEITDSIENLDSLRLGTKLDSCRCNVVSSCSTTCIFPTSHEII